MMMIMMMVVMMIHIDIMEYHDGGMFCHIMTHNTENAMEITGRMKTMMMVMMMMVMMIAMMTMTMMMMMGLMMVVMIIHNDIKGRYERGMLCRMIKSAMERIRRMKVMMMMMMMIS